MTSSEKKVFFLGAGAGVAAVVLAGAVLAVRAGHVFASQPGPASMPVQRHSDRGETDSAQPRQQGTQPGATVQLTPTEITAAGVQVADVRTAVLKTSIDAFGRVEQPESQLAAVSAWIGGRVDKLHVLYTGEQVRRGQPLAELYSPEVATALEEYRLAQEHRNRLAESEDAYARSQADSLVAAARRKLELWGITPQQITDADGAGGEGVPHVTIYANAGGTVVERKVTQGQYVTPGETLFTLADLGEIWIKADVYEDQFPHIHPGQDVDITSEALPNRTLHGHVQFIEPTTNPQTRTVPVHIHLPNPGMRLMPGMFVGATFMSRAAAPSVVVPRSAVLDTGTHRLVYVAKPDGVFEAREVKTGTPSEDVFPVTSGLKAGEKVVLNGNFMIDSQAQLTSGMTGLFGGSREFATGQPQQGGNASGVPANAARIELHAAGDLKGAEGNAFQATLTDPNGKPISDAEVTVTLVMPAMPAMNMPEMRNAFALQWSPGQQMYTGKGAVPMAGSWNATVEARKNGAVIAAARTRLTAK